MDEGSLRTCRICSVEKPVVGFTPAKERPNGRRTECKACTKIKQDEYYRNNKTRYYVANKRRREENREYITAQAKLYYEANKERQKIVQYKNKYNLSHSRLLSLLSSQDGKCAACLCELLKPYVDHDHACCPGKKSCGKCIRGLLCGNCNTAIGMMKDDPNIMLRASEYVRKSKKEDSE